MRRFTKSNNTKSFVKTKPNNISHFCDSSLSADLNDWSFKMWTKKLASFCSVCLIQVSNNRNDHKSQVWAVCIHFIRGVRWLQVFFTVNVGKEKNGTCTDVCLIEGARLIWGPLNTGWLYVKAIYTCFMSILKLF